jgi:hypothetical protein
MAKRNQKNIVLYMSNAVINILITMYWSLAWYSVYNIGRLVSIHEMTIIITAIITMKAINAAVVPFQNPSVFMK